MINSHFMIYTSFIIVIIYLILVGIIRAKMQFWNTQPVFHIYNLKYWLKPPGFINLRPPEVNKFVNLVNNELITIDNEVSISTIKIKQICNFIRDYYVIHPNACYKPSEEDIMAYLQCNNHSSYFNIYQEPCFLFDHGKEPSSATITEDQDIIGVASARVLNVALYSSNKATCRSFAAYYVDNLCVKPAYRKKGIPPQMIQTFYYNVARQNKKVNAYMFKREGTLTAIVPLVYFDTYGFDITYFYSDVILNPSMSVIVVGEQQLNVLISFLKEQKKRFECTVVPDISSILNLIKLEKLLIYAVLFNGELLNVYIFRPLELYYTGDDSIISSPTETSNASATAATASSASSVGKTIECIAIISSGNNKDILIAGFNMSLLKVKAKCGAATLLVEETAHSSPVIKALSMNSTVLRKFKSPTAFFLYNYACHSVKKEKALLIY